jgi:hypothetical protein
VALTGEINGTILAHKTRGTEENQLQQMIFNAWHAMYLPCNHHFKKLCHHNLTKLLSMSLVHKKKHKQKRRVTHTKTCIINPN